MHARTDAAHEILDGVRLRRTVTATVSAALAVVGLTACQTKIGLAASAEGQRLTDSTLSSFVQPGAKTYTDSSSGTAVTVTPKVFALQNWVDNQIFASVVSKHGGAATTAELATARSTVLGSHTAADYQKYYGGLGYTHTFAGLILDQSAILVVLVERLAHTSATNAIQLLNSGQSGAALLKSITASKPQVTISPRYGTWNATNLALTSDAGSGAPAFVSFPGSGKATVVPGTTP